MNKYILIIFFSVCFIKVQAQQNHFVYLQTYNNQPFYLRLDGKVLSSSATGYLIIPKLNNGTYQLIIGFAKNEWPEQAYNINVKANTGYELKNFNEKGWGLFDLQNAEVIMGNNTNVAVVTNNTGTKKKADAFADMLSNVVNDSTIRVDDTLPKNSVSIKSQEEEKLVVANTISESNPVKELLYSDIKRSLNNTNADGIERIYIDNNGKSIDTIKLFFIPSVKEVINTDEKKSPQVITDKEVTIIPAEKKENPTTKITPEQNTTPKFIDDKDKTEPTSKESKIAVKEGLSMINSDCHSTASEDDFFKLRKRMASEKNDEDMIKTSKKTFKSKCFSTSYIKNLSVLFLTDKGRYSFFDMAYPFVSDSQNFPALEKELTDDYYITRFRAMIHK